MIRLASLILATTLALALVAPARGETDAAQTALRVTNAFALTTGAAAAIYLDIENLQPDADTLISARSVLAQKVIIHQSAESADGVMRMAETTLPIPAAGRVSLRPGHDHIMLMGLTQPLTAGDSIPLTLTFEHAGDVTLDVPVTRAPPAAPAP